jgi:16S rRNA (cytosine967-C5)-methyltransferase
VSGGARDVALADLDHRRLPGWKPNLLRRRPKPDGLGPRDQALAEQLLIGCIKNHLLLLHLISHYSGRSLKSVDPVVQKILALGLYQLRFLDRVPASAAVNEAVEQTKRFGQSKAAGFVNAVLRKAASNPDAPLTQRDQDPAAYAEVCLSHPRPLFDRLVALLGIESALAFCEHDNREPPTLVRLAAGADPTALQAPGVTVTPHERAGTYIIEPAKKALLAVWARRGIAQVQDATSAAVVEQLAITPGQELLDRCAGLGTKTLQMREKLGPSGRIVAIDPAADRIARLRDILKARQIENVEVYPQAMIAGVPELRGRTFDIALLDVPCSNSGVLARRPEARYAQTRASLASLEKLQAAILDDTAPHLRPGGVLLYSTCSVWPEENQQQVDAFLRRRSGEYVKQAEQSTLPSASVDKANYHDGGYWALLRRVRA